MRLADELGSMRYELSKGWFITTDGVIGWGSSNVAAAASNKSSSSAESK